MVLASESESSIAAAIQARSKGAETDPSGSDLFGIFCLKQFHALLHSQSLLQALSKRRRGVYFRGYSTTQMCNTAASGLDENLTLQTHDPLQHTELGKPVCLLQHLFICLLTYLSHLRDKVQYCKFWVKKLSREKKKSDHICENKWSKQLLVPPSGAIIAVKCMEQLARSLSTRWGGILSHSSSELFELMAWADVWGFFLIKEKPPLKCAFTQDIFVTKGYVMK